MNNQTANTAREMGLMNGFPPAPDKLVTHENQLYAPYNRWSFQNELPLNRVVDVWRGSGPVAGLDEAPLEIERVTYKNRLGKAYTFGDMLEMSCTDGIVVLHHGKIVFERYFNDMQPHSLHAWASGSKSMTGVLAAQLAHERLFDPDALVTDTLPELKGSGFEGATVQQLMDMTTGISIAADGPSQVTEGFNYGVALGWLERPAGYTGPETAYDYLPAMKKEVEHGQRFIYLTQQTDVLAWMMKRLLNQSLAEITRERIWSKLGAERDAFWITGSAAVETAGSGLLTTLRDMARFGQMLLQKGQFNGQKIISPEVVEDIQNGADPAVFARGSAAGPTNQGWSYHHQWWMTHDKYDAYQCLGYGGQILYVAPGADLVIAKFSSYPTPTPAGNEFYGAFAAFPALADWLVKNQ